MQKSKKKIFFILIPAVVISLAAILLICFGIQSHKTIGYVNGMRVDRRELQLIFTEKCRETKRHFSDNYDVQTFDDAFWDTKFSDETPREYLEEIIWNELVKLKIEQELFSEYNLCEKFDYKTFLKSLKKENQYRQEAKENNKVFFGPERFDEKEFYDYLQNNYRIKLQKQLEPELTETNENKLKQYYEATKESKYRKGLEGKIGIITQRDDENPEQSLTEYQILFQAGMSIEEFQQSYAEQIQHGEVNYTEMALSSSGKKMLTTLEKKYLELLNRLQVNETALMQISDIWQLIICLNKEENSYYPFEEVKGNVQGDLFQVNYEEKIVESAKDAHTNKTSNFYQVIEKELKIG